MAEGSPAIKMWRNPLYEERLRELKLFSVEKRRLGRGSYQHVSIPGERVHCDTIMDCVTRATSSPPWQALKTGKTVYLWGFFLMIYWLHILPQHLLAAFPFVVHTEFWIMGWKKSAQLLRQMILINIRHAILDSTSNKKKPRLQCRCVVTLWIYKWVKFWTTFFLNGLSV